MGRSDGRPVGETVGCSLGRDCSGEMGFCMINRQFEIKVNGLAVEAGQISFALLGKILKGIQDTVYYLALADLQYDYRQRIRVPQDVKQACAIYRVVEKKGSYCLIAEMAPSQQVGGIDDLGLAAKEKYIEVLSCLKENALERLNHVVPDSSYRRKVLRTIASYCPKSGEKWEVGIGTFGQERAVLKPDLVKTIRDVLVKPAFEQMMIIGELVQLHLDENKLGLFYAPANKVIHCTYDPELEDFIVSNLRELIQVHGQVQMDGRGVPEKIVDVLEIEEVDLSPVVLSAIHAEGKTLILAEELNISVGFDRESQEFTLEHPILNIIVGSGNREELVAEYCSDFFWLWREYGQGDPLKMSADGQRLRESMLGLVKKESSA